MLPRPAGWLSCWEHELIMIVVFSSPELAWAKGSSELLSKCFVCPSHVHLSVQGKIFYLSGTAEQIWRHFTGSKNPRSFTKFVFSGWSGQGQTQGKVN